MNRRSRSSTPQKTFHTYVKQDAAEFLPEELNKWSDYANYLQHRIAVGQMYWEAKENGYVSLNRQTLEDAIHHSILRPLLEYMLDRVIERDGSREDWTNWKPARRRDGSDGVSIGYRFCEAYDRPQNQRVACRSVKANNKFLKLQNHSNRMQDNTKVHKHLRRWVRRLNLDQIAALQLVEKSNLEPKTADQIINLVKYIANGDATGLTVDRFGRVHTAVTRLWSPIRGCLSIGGQPLVELDVATSQPLFLAIFILKTIQNPRIRTLPAILTTVRENTLLNGIHCGDFSGHSSTTMSNVAPTNHQAHTTHHLYVPRKCQKRDVTDSNSNALQRNKNQSQYVPPDLSLFIEMCTTGTLYDHLMKQIAWTKDRSDFKKAIFFKFLYGPVEEDTPLAQAMASEFPSVMAFIVWHKRRHGYKELSREMQRAESRLMIEGVCGSLMEQNLKIPLVTIHDSITTTPEFVPVVRAAIEEEFHKLGIDPTVKVKGNAIETAIPSQQHGECDNFNQWELAA